MEYGKPQYYSNLFLLFRKHQTEALQRETELKSELTEHQRVIETKLNDIGTKLESLCTTGFVQSPLIKRNKKSKKLNSTTSQRGTTKTPKKHYNRKNQTSSHKNQKNLNSRVKNTRNKKLNNNSKNSRIKKSKKQIPTYNTNLSISKGDSPNYSFTKSRRSISNLDRNQFSGSDFLYYPSNQSHSRPTSNGKYPPHSFRFRKNLNF